MNELKELLINEVSLVDAGANPEANIVFFKRKEPKQMADKEINKNEKPEAPVEKKDEAVETPAPVEKKDEVAPVINVEVKPVEKVDLSALTNDLNALKERLSSHIEKVEQAEFVKIASKYEILGEKADELAKTLKTAKAAGEETYNSVIKALDTALDIVEKSGTFKEIGKAGSGQADSPQSQIEKIAADIRAKDASVDYRKSIDLAFQSRPDLIY